MPMHRYIRHAYMLATPWIQFFYALTVVGGILSGVWMIYGFIQQSNASAATLSDYVEFKDDTRENLMIMKQQIAVMKQEVDDIHDLVRADLQ